MQSTLFFKRHTQGASIVGLKSWLSLVNRLANGNQFIAWSLHFYLATFVLTLAAVFIDPRIITGQLAWIKPLKFSISILIYTLTLLWMLGFVDTTTTRKRRLVQTIVIATTIAFLGEMAGVWIQAFRGVRSHFNVGSGFDGFIFSMMGTLVLVIWVMNLLAATLLLFERLPNRVFAWSLRLALVITLVGAGLAGLMLSPNAEQTAVIAAGEMPTTVGAHSVGVDDGGAGMAITGWSTEGGDLRVPHFVGLHALQIIPFMGLLIQRRRRQLSESRQTTLVWVGSLGYIGLMGILTWQALRGQALIAPDVFTLGAVAVLIVAVVGAWRVVEKG